MNQAIVLTFNLPEDVFARVRSLSTALGVRVKAVPQESFTLPIGAMAGMPAKAVHVPVEHATFVDPMLVMCNLDEAQFNQFLRMLRTPGIPRIPLKAVLTPHNAGWNALMLYEELSREHEAMRRLHGK